MVRNILSEKEKEIIFNFDSYMNSILLHIFEKYQFPNIFSIKTLITRISNISMSKCT